MIRFIVGANQVEQNKMTSTTGAVEIRYCDFVIVIGIILLIAGFLLIIPGGSLPGSVGVRNVRIGSSHIVKTPGYGAAPSRRRKRTTVIAGLVIFGLGLLFIALGS